MVKYLVTGLDWKLDSIVNSRLLISSLRVHIPNLNNQSKCFRYSKRIVSNLNLQKPLFNETSVMVI